jgi:ribosome-binding factor A
MPRDFPRSRRVEDQIQRILSDVLRGQARDPRLARVIVTAVKVSRDLSVARVYVTSLDLDRSGDELLESLRRAGGFLRSALAAELTVRQVPELRFQYDDSTRQAERMDALIDQALGSDSNDEPDDQGQQSG